MGRTRWIALITLLLTCESLSQTQNVGRRCEQSTECGSGSYCASNKRCACLSSYTDIDGYCWRKINPGEAGCSDERQCSAVWPGSYCSSGTCRCANNRDPFPTPDGLVCVNYGGCPVGGIDTTLKYQDGNIQNFCLVTNGYGCPSTYDCVCRDAQCTDIQTNFCCPSRAFACAQPYEVGQFPNGGGGTLGRWYHDTVTDECKPFNYRGSKGNANNFETKEHSCERGRPSYDTEADPSLSTKNGLMMAGPKTCTTGSSSSTGICGVNYECKTTGTRQYCCPTVDHICSQLGGITYPSPEIQPTTLYDPGQRSGPNSETYSRFYYDKSVGRCRPFTYNGQAGNFNNFLSENDCELYCSRTVCKAGLPLKDSTGITNIKCNGDTSCPNSHECKSNLCCPRPQFVCKLDQMVGSCASFTTRWWFNAQTGNCEEFSYSGCQGNANNFGEYTDCQSFCKDTRVEPKCIQGKALTDANKRYTVCGGSGGQISTCPMNHYCYFDGNTYGCCPNQAYTCSLNSNEGRQCGPSVTRWFFDSTAQKCVTFDYKGCDGNSNNFATQQDCNEYCTSGSCPDGGEVFHDRNGQPRSCSTDEQCSGTHYCTTITVQSRTGQTAANRCCPTKSYICAQYKDSGTRCSATTIPRYYFNPDTKTCDEFEYNGCAGNRNNFATKAQCQNYCLAAACPVGEMIHFGTDTSILSSCTSVGGVGVSASCPEDYTCYNSLTLGQNVCCGTPAEMRAICPANSRPFISSLTLQPRQCTPNIVGTCPAGYFCWYSADSATNSFYCCEEASQQTQNVCPPQLKPLPGSNGQKYRFCSPTGTGSDCGDNNYCQHADSIARYVCCGASGQDLKPSWLKVQFGFCNTPSHCTNDDICPPEPAGLVPVYIERGNYRRCAPTAVPNTSGACSSGSACLYVGGEAEFICCEKLTKKRKSEQETGNLGAGGGESGSDDCSNEPGFYPQQPFIACSPLAPSKCNTGNTSHQNACLFSQQQDRFICCYKE